MLASVSIANFKRIVAWALISPVHAGLRRVLSADCLTLLECFCFDALLFLQVFQLLLPSSFALLNEESLVVLATGRDGCADEKALFSLQALTESAVFLFDCAVSLYSDRRFEAEAGEGCRVSDFAEGTVHTPDLV